MKQIVLLTCLLAGLFMQDAGAQYWEKAGLFTSDDAEQRHIAAADNGYYYAQDFPNFVAFGPDTI